MKRIHEEITRIERSHDNLWSVREDLHTRFDGVLKAHFVDSVLDGIAAGYEGRINRFRKIFIEKKATEELRTVVATRPSHLRAA